LVGVDGRVAPVLAVLRRIRKRDHDPAAGLRHARQLAQSLLVARLRDVLEDRDAVGVVKARVLERQGTPVGDLEAEIVLPRCELPPALDLGFQLIHRDDLYAAARKGHGSELGTGEVEHALARPRAQLAHRLGQLEIPARIERNDDADDRLAQVAVPKQVAQPEPDARPVELAPAAHASSQPAARACLASRRRRLMLPSSAAVAARTVARSGKSSGPTSTFRTGLTGIAFTHSLPHSR